MSEMDIVSFTKRGHELALTIEGGRAYSRCSSFFDRDFYVRDMTAFLSERFESRTPIIFIGATGIAVRLIAPFVNDKTKDTAVIVMDEGNNFVIPILSGHLGGANELAVSLAKKTGAAAVITTATDINSEFAVDMFAKRNHLLILQKDGIAEVSSKLLAGNSITVSVDETRVSLMPSDKKIEMVEYPPAGKVDVLITEDKKIFDQASVTLVPRKYILGAGCRRDKKEEEFNDFIEWFLFENGIDEELVGTLSSIDIKKDEECLINWSRKRNCEFRTFSSEELSKSDGDFSVSEFVREKTGVSNVCERAAVAAGGRLLIKKTAGCGVTAALAIRDWSVSFDE